MVNQQKLLGAVRRRAFRPSDFESDLVEEVLHSGLVVLEADEYRLTFEGKIEFYTSCVLGGLQFLVVTTFRAATMRTSP